MNAGQSMRRYRLRATSFLCVVAEGGVILDLQGNQYLGLSSSQMQALSIAVQGWPLQMDTGKTTAQAAQKVAHKLARMGLLTEDLAAGKDAHPVQLTRAETRLVELDASLRPPRVLSHLKTLALSCISVGVLLKTRSLSYVVARINKRKRQRFDPSADFDFTAARTLMQSFFWLRPLLYTAADHCLFDSLVLIEFLAQNGLYPTLVIGVKAFAPFAAHSWVQYERYALTGAPEWLNAYVPILAI